MISHGSQATNFDIAIIGGGPSGTTLASIVKKYNPDLSIVILEKEKFPREHVGESQLPGILLILDEMEVWDKVEAANFPIKLGGSYTWGKEADAWDFDFIPRKSLSMSRVPPNTRGNASTPRSRWSVIDTTRFFFVMPSTTGVWRFVKRPWSARFSRMAIASQGSSSIRENSSPHDTKSMAQVIPHCSAKRWAWNRKHQAN